MNNSFKYLIKILMGIYLISFFFICFFLDGYTSNVISYESHFTFSQFLSQDKSFDEFENDKVKLIGQSFDFKIALSTQSDLKNSLQFKRSFSIQLINNLSLFKAKRTIFIRAPSSTLFT